ncbi:hypothetical protein, partial [Microbacterium sp.]|uniref:hypothetical protein n=1 Tax=Microbacterium sp. TaxID=51671 RepID=UPI0039E6E9E8
MTRDDETLAPIIPLFAAQRGAKSPETSSSGAAGFETAGHESVCNVPPRTGDYGRWRSTRES